MAPKFSPNSLIHCAVCGEDYSATYKRCPFCGAKNIPSVTPPKNMPPAAPDPGPERDPDPDDTYVFDGQDLFDDPEDDAPPAYPKGGKRLAEKPSSGPFASAEINWPRMITFLCSLIIIVAALVIVFTAIYPKLRGEKDPVADSTESVSPEVTGSVDEPSRPVEPAVSDPVADVTDPVTEPTDILIEPDDFTMSFARANDGDFTLEPNGTHTITLKFDPADWSGEVTWSSTNPSVATVDANGKVTNVNTGSKLRTVVITAAANGVSLESKVFCKGVPAAEPSNTPASEPPAPPETPAQSEAPVQSEPPIQSDPPVQSEAPIQSDPPVTNTQTPSGGNVTVGRQGTIVNAELGLRVRSGPGTGYSVLASLRNGQTVNVLEAAEGGWYKITFPGAGGAATEGYILGEYISTD